MLEFDSRGGFGTGFLIAGAGVYYSGSGGSAATVPSLAGATTTPAQLRRVEPARLHSVARAQLKEAD